MTENEVFVATLQNNMMTYRSVTARYHDNFQSTFDLFLYCVTGNLSRALTQNLPTTTSFTTTSKIATCQSSDCLDKIPQVLL